MKIAYVFAGVVLLALAAAMLPGSDEEWTENPVETPSDEAWTAAEVETGTEEGGGLMGPLQQGQWLTGGPILASIGEPADGQLVPANSDIRCSVDSCDFDHWTGPDPPECDYGMKKTFYWTATEGTSGQGPEAGEWPYGRQDDVVWWRTSTPGLYTLSVAVDDQLWAPWDAPSANDTGVNAEEITVKVVKVVLTKCPNDWMPLGWTQDNSVQFTATIYPADVTGTIRFELFGVSHEPGYCMNAPNPPPQNGEDSSTWKDLQFPQQTGFTISGEGNCVATKNAAANTATVTVNCYDYGACGRIRAIANINYNDYTAYEEGSETKQYTCIPLDQDENDIADGWEWNEGEAGDDNDSDPEGNEMPGDGLSRYEEYRGFVLGGAYERLDPMKKDVFVRNADVTDAGTSGFFTTDALTAPVHAVGLTEYMAVTLEVNFNRSEYGQDQKAIFVFDGGDDGGEGLFGQALGTSEPWVPNRQVYCIVYVGTIKKGTKIDKVGGISADDTTIPVESTYCYRSTGTIRIEDEQITYAARSGTSFAECTRGANGTTKVAHANSTKVYYFLSETDEIKRVFAHEAGHLVGLEDMADAAKNVMCLSDGGTKLGDGCWDTFIGQASSLTGKFVVKE